MTKPIINTVIKNKGFTLIEVLVATVILVASLAVIAMIYRGAYLSSNKANQHIVIKAALPSILANIRNDIRKQGNNDKNEIFGKGTGWQANYEWRAELKAFKSAPDRIESDQKGFVTPPKKYKLWLVTLTLKTKEMVKEYQFKELSWNNV